jgi:tRNA threonylcarbamoyladenosine biosynthesis protein TsaE
MPPPDIYHSSSAEQTAAIARRLAPTLAPGTVLALIGPLGAGKTAFVQGLASGLGIPPRDVVSPTYTLIHEHAGTLPLFHADLYRLAGPGEAAELGLEGYAERGGILAVEWAERAAGLLPAGTLRVTFEILGARERRISIQGR